MPGLLDIIGGLLGGGVLGGQAPPQQRAAAPQEPPTLPGYGGGNNLMAGLSNLQSGGSPAGALVNMLTGFTTGQRTDPVGAYQQQANMVYRLLRQNGVPDAQAQLGAIDPNVQKEIIGRMFPHWKFENINGTLVPTSETLGTINYPGAYTAPRETALSPGQGLYQSNPMVGGRDIMPGGVPRQSPISVAPLPGVGAGTPGTTGAPTSVPSSTTGAPLGGAGTPQSLPPATPGVPTGAPPPPTAGAPGAGGRMLVAPMSVKQEAAEREAGRIAGGAEQTLKPTVDELQSTVDMIDALAGNPEKKILPHPGKAWAVGRALGVPLGSVPAISGTPQGDFVDRLQQLQTIASKQLGGDEKIKDTITGLGRAQTLKQFDEQAATLRKTFTDKIEAARQVAGVGTPGAPAAPQTSPSATATGATGTSTAGGGAPKPSRADRFNQLVRGGATPNQAHAVMVQEGY